MANHFPWFSKRDLSVVLGRHFVFGHLDWKGCESKHFVHDMIGLSSFLKFHSDRSIPFAALLYEGVVLFLHFYIFPITTKSICTRFSSDLLASFFISFLLRIYLDSSYSFQVCRGLWHTLYLTPRNSQL